MDTREQPPSDERGTWLQGRDMLPPNIPNQGGQQLVAPPEVSAPVRRPRPWSLLLGLPLLILILLGAAWVVTSGGDARSKLLANLPGRAAATATVDPGIRAASDVGGDPLLSARIQTRPPVPKAPVLYLEAQAKGDGQTAWNLLSLTAQQQITQQGGSAAALTQALQQSPLPPVKQITFVGGSVMGDGREATIFVVTADVNGALRQVPYYFTVDTQGKIDEVH